MISPNLYYEIALAPNSDDDSTTPEDLGNLLKNL